MSNEKRFQDFKKEVEKLREIDGAEEYAKQLAHLFLGNGLSLQTILLMAIEFGQQHPAWVSVEERLPKITIDGWRSEDVFFATDDSKSHFGFYSNKGVWFSSVYGFNGHQATHWMPLPTPPVKKGGNDESD